MLILAYIDPGTGSILLQALIGGGIAGLVTLKFYWGRVKQFVMRRSDPNGGNNNGRS